MKKRIIETRRIFHQYPELGWNTYFSSTYIASKLQALGYEIKVGKEIFQGIPQMDPPSQEEKTQAQNTARQALCHYMDEAAITYWMDRMGNHAGVIARIQGKKTKREKKECLVKAYRFDMDALAVTESKSEERVPVQEGFQSRYPGVFHACGHDGHMAIGLELAYRTAEKLEDLEEEYVFIFQPAEEGVRGAMALVEAWDKKKFIRIDELYCCHIGFSREDVFVAGAEGFLATSKFDIVFHGKASHAALAPERGRNALLAAAEAVVKMQDIPQIQGKISRLNVGQMQAGSSRNIIPAYAWIQVETRGEDSETNLYMKDQALACVKESCEKYGVRYEVSYKGESVSAKSSPALVNKICEIAGQIEDHGGFAECIKTCRFTASDDGAVMMDYVMRQGGQAAYLLFGCKLRGLHHESEFDFDEGVLEKAIRLYEKTL